jgi:Rrf2 family iron-sulfur cluster assembly transcriptional regulator
MISKTGKYALRTLSYLTCHREQWVLAKEIAAATGIPLNYLSKILSQLRKRGFVHSQKGWGGGFKLREDSLNLPIINVLHFFEGIKNERDCLFGLSSCDAKNPCPLHAHWDVIRGCAAHMFQDITVRDLKTQNPG